MTSVRIIKHEAIPNCGSYEVRYSDGRPSRYFYWDDLPGRRLDPTTLTGGGQFVVDAHLGQGRKRNLFFVGRGFGAPPFVHPLATLLLREHDSKTTFGAQPQFRRIDLERAKAAAQSARDS
jgi:hypothetical protein